MPDHAIDPLATVFAQTAGADGVGPETWVAAISVIVALLSLFANYTIVRRQVAIQAEQVGATLDAEKARWLGDVLAGFGEAAALVQARVGVYTPQEFTRRRIELANRFSALADLGRLYFPNVAPDDHGADKLGAYRGKRRPVLDAVVLAHDVVGCLDQAGDIADEPFIVILFDLRRIVVSEVQHSNDPRRREAILAQTRRMRLTGAGVPREAVRDVVARIAELPVQRLSFEAEDLPADAADKAAPPPTRR